MCNLSVPQAKAELRDQAACHKCHPKERNQILLMRGFQLVQHLFFFYIINFLKETIPRSLHYSHLDARKLAGCWVSAHIGHGSRHVDSTAIKMQ